MLPSENLVLMVSRPNSRVCQALRSTRTAWHTTLAARAMARKLCFTALFATLLCAVLCARAHALCSLMQACQAPASCPIFADAAPPQFEVHWSTTRGNFTMHVTTSWAPPYAQRLWVLAKLGYFVGGPFFRVLNMPHATPPQAFVAQWGYSGNPPVDNCWDKHLTSNATWSVHEPGNVRGTVTFAMDGVANTHTNPNCSSTSSYCAQGFSSNIFINLQDNSKLLDPPGFSPIGTVDAAGMAVVDALYAGYGEVASLCPAGAQDPFCVGTGAACQGVNVTRLLAGGMAYVKREKPLLDVVVGVTAVAA